MIKVASHFNGWNIIWLVVAHAFRYAIFDDMVNNKNRVPKGTPSIDHSFPAVKTAGYLYLMPMASVLHS